MYAIKRNMHRSKSTLKQLVIFAICGFALTSIIASGYHPKPKFLSSESHLSRLSPKGGPRKFFHSTFLGDRSTRTRLALSTPNFLSPEFARNVARIVHPSLALVTPTGVRNATARGSGFVVDFENSENGDQQKRIYVLTAAHVAAPGRRIEVSFPVTNNNNNNGNTTTTESSWPATVVGRDLKADLALICITDNNCTDFPQPKALVISEEMCPDVGTIVLANGFPGGVKGPAMTLGIVCAITSDLFFSSDSDIENGKNNSDFSATPYIVTDAAMAGGMSGGPLVDVNGVVLGVNALVRPDLRALGNYAVEASECRAFLQQLTSKRPSKTDATLGNDGNGCVAYRVVLFNDRMNTRARVAQVLQDAGLDEKTANATMLEAHRKGRGVVNEFPGDKNGRIAADDLCNELQRADVLVEVEEKFAAE